MTDSPASTAAPKNTGDGAAPRGSAAPAETFRILEGDCWAYFAFDIGYGIDLNAAQTILTATAAPPTEEARRAGIPHQRRAPQYLQFQPAPLKLDQPTAEPAKLDLAGFRALSRLECTLYDFGAISVAYRIPLIDSAEGV